MILTADSKRRVTLPKSAHPGDAFAVEMPHEGLFVLTKLEKPSFRVKLARENGFLVAVRGKPITMKQTRALMDEFP
ncbi:MAG TPA: hypothetical protein VGO67_25385 [Verrucomicrobiae bacterium]|jgi:hypothetical protein